MALKQSLHSELSAIDAETAAIDVQISDLRKRKKTLESKKEEVLGRLKASQRRDQDSDWEKTTFPWSKAVDLIRSTMGIASFRHLQLSTINATMGLKDCILIMPTGGGKSLCYQIPAAATKGISVVISPLVSLMEDQFLSLQKYGLEGAVFHSGLSAQQSSALLSRLMDPSSNLKIIYVTPERIAKTKTFNMRMEALYEAGRLARIVIDEVHCCSQWGHDFRPDYKALNILKRQYPNTPILGLTATATVRVLQDVQDMLGMQGALIFRAPFNRRNLFYEVQNKPASHEAAINQLADLIKHRFENQSGIVYCLSIKDTEDVARDLVQHGVKARCYHASLAPDVRSKTHHAWLNNSINVVVATVAFGMGIDKPDVRFVIHHTLSKSIETFYQESGRAGRDGEKASCVLFYKMQDVFRMSSLTFHEKVGQDNLQGMLRYAHNISECRRAPLAEHFGEEWTSEMCAGMCDVCKKKWNRRVLTIDVTNLAKEAVQAIEKARGRSKTGKCTAIQLMESWLGKSRPKLGDVKVASQQECERIVIELLLRDFLKLAFHATAYSYVVYINPGPQAPKLLKGQATIEMAFEINEKVLQKTGVNKTISAVVNGPSPTKVTPEEINLEEEIDWDMNAYDYDDDFGVAPPPPVVAEASTSAESVADDDEVTFVKEVANDIEFVVKSQIADVELDFGDLEEGGKATAKVHLSEEVSMAVMKRSVSRDSLGGKKRRGLF